MCEEEDVEVTVAVGDDCTTCTFAHCTFAGAGGALAVSLTRRVVRILIPSLAAHSLVVVPVPQPTLTGAIQRLQGWEGRRSSKQAPCPSLSDSATASFKAVLLVVLMVKVEAPL